MTILHSTIKKLITEESWNKLRAKFFYPKIVIFEDLNSFRILDLQDKNNDGGKVYKVEDEISDCALQDHLLWVILKSGEMLVTNLLNGVQLKVIVSNYSNLKFHETSTNNFLFKSEGGEYLIPPYSTPELEKIYKEGLTELCVSLKKTCQSNSELSTECPLTIMNGLNMYIETGQLVSECPITRQRENILSLLPMDYTLSWEDYIILADKRKMWIVDLKNSSVVFELESLQTYYVPVAVHNSILYYLMCSDQEVCICHARISTASSSKNNRDTDSSSTTTETATSQETLTAELNFLVDAIIAAGKPAPISPQLQSLFETIEDLKTLIDVTLKLYKFNNMYKPILYTLHKRVFISGDEKLIHSITDILIKVDLIEYINFRGNINYENINILEMNCKQLCIAFITNMDFDVASICWLKYSELKLFLTSEDIIEILNAIPSNTKMGAIVIWFKNFVPSLLEQNPFNIDIFVRWAMERIFILEQSSYWPKIGLKFIEEITTALELSLRIISIRPISIDDLDMLKDRINYISELKEKYKINMLLSELSSQSPSEVALIMLRRCYTEDLEAFLQDYLPTYATRHLFDMDEVLQNFIESETASSGGTVDGTRLDIILNAFRSLSSKLDCLLNVLKVLDVPWSSAVLQLAINAATSATKDFTVSDSDHLLAQEIQKEVNYANFKVVLKKYNFPLTCTEYALVLHKLVSGPVVDLNDLKAVTTVVSAYVDYGNALYINKCLENCDTRSALDYFHNMRHKEKNILLKTIMAKYEQIINGVSRNTAVERNYIDFLKGTHLLNDIQLNNIDSLYHLKYSYNITLDMNNIYNETNCAINYNNWLREDKEARGSSGRGGSMSRLMPISESQYSSLLTLLRGISATSRVRTFIESLLQSQSGDKSIIENVLGILGLFKDGQNPNLLLESCNILIELINRCEEEHINDLIRHLSVLNALVNANITVKNLTIAWKFNYVFLPISSGTAINEFIDFVSGKLAENKDFEMNAFNIQNKCDFIPFRIISSDIAGTNDNAPLSDSIIELGDKTTKRLLARVVSAQEFDEVLTTILLVLLKNIESMDNDDCILDVLRGQSDSLSPTLTGYLSSPSIRRTFSYDNNLQGNTVAYPPLYILKSKFNINLSEIPLPENTEETWDVKVILFYILKQHPDTSSERLIELCHAMNVSINDGLSLLLISLLSSWTLKYKLCSNEFGCRQISVENNPNLIDRCLVIWDNIENKDFLIDVLNDFWKNGEVTLHGRVVSVNPYYYEVFLCIHRLLFETTTDSSCMKEYYLLNFLNDYKRVSTPKQYEFEMFSVKGMFPEIGYYRLPFHLFIREDMWANLKSEITLETYERWLPIVSLLSLDADLQIAKDMICSNALKQTMTTRNRNDGTDNDKKDTEPWRLTSREEPLLRAAHRCVRHIANMEWAGACLFYVLQGCTRGADQVAAAQLCYQFAQRWAALQPGNRAVKQMERLHATLSTRHVLYKIEWACEEFVRLCTEPAQLIRTLYLHPDFVNKIARHDVNRAANEIADKNNVNISSIRIQILGNLLDKSGENNKDRRSPLTNKELMTAKYILRATCPKMGAIYLSRIAFDDDSDYNKCKKLRALQCLMSVVEPDTAMKVTNREREALWISLLELLSTVKLENIDMPWVIVTFMQDKCRALEQLLLATDGNVDGLRITAELAKHFGNVQIIRKLIPLLLRSGLYEEMIPLLLKISAPPDNVICAAWRAVILSPFQRADYPITERQKRQCLNAVNLLPICPVIKDEDLKDIWKNCVRLKIFGLGCLVLPYMTPQARQSLLELQKIDRRNLIASLKNLHAETYLVSGAMHVIESMASRVYR